MTKDTFGLVIQLSVHWSVYRYLAVIAREQTTIKVVLCIHQNWPLPGNASTFPRDKNLPKSNQTMQTIAK